MTARKIIRLIAALTAISFLAGCHHEPSNRIQGYIEGEFVYASSPYAGTLKVLSVQRGAQVNAGDQLFALENTVETAGRDEAERRLTQARANLEDAKKGRRPSEKESIEAQLQQVRSALELSEKELARQEKLFRTGAATEQEFDRARSTRDQNKNRVAQLEADLKTAQLGSREDQVAAAEASVHALEAALRKAEWDLSQKTQSAPKAGVVFDTLYREGEFVAAGRPVVALLPPENIKVRAFVPEEKIGAVHLNDRVQVIIDGVNQPFDAKVSFISPKAEFTPPVIYSRENRSKLVFMIEAVFSSTNAANLHPGQPVDVQFNF